MNWKIKKSIHKKGSVIAEFIKFNRTWLNELWCCWVMPFSKSSGMLSFWYFLILLIKFFNKCVGNRLINRRTTTEKKSIDNSDGRPDLLHRFCYPKTTLDLVGFSS